MAKKEKSENKPHEIVLPFNGGILKAAIFKHDNEVGRPRFSVALSRAYKASGNDKWETSSFLQRDDLHAIPHLTHLAFQWIVENSETGGVEK